MGQRSTVRLRDYQIDGESRVADAIARGVRRILLVLATGGGKTSVAASFICHELERGRTALVIAHRRELIGQAYRRLIEFGLPEESVGVIMANDPRRRPAAPIQVASIDTLRSRAKPPADLVIIDEAHRALARTYVELVAAYPRAVHLGLTATPYRADGRGLGDAFDELIVVASPRLLIAQGHLVEPRVFTVPAAKRPDLSQVRVERGDYSAEALAEAVDRQSLVGNIVEHWTTHARDVRTVVFAVSVAHSKHIVERFQAAGVPAEHLDGTTPTTDRDALLARVDRGETLVVSNVNCLAEGWDQPAVKCAILARPTKSTGLYLQQAGRILRPWQDQPAIILDHGGCAVEHGLPQDDREFSLDNESTRKRKNLEPRARECPSCSAVVGLMARVCPACGHVLVADRELPTEDEEQLVEVHAGELAAPSPRRARSNLSEALRSAVHERRGRLSWAKLDESL